jgi:hypothetical protein
MIGKIRGHNLISRSETQDYVPGNLAAGNLAADVWINEGDSDGDGLSDIFEQSVGLDPQNADTNGDGAFDEYEAGPDGRDYFDLQLDGYTPDDPTDPGSGGGGGGCFLSSIRR